MNELSREAREALEQGLLFDAPSAERRARVKARVMAALGGGAAALGASTAAAETGSAVVAGVAAGATAGKGLALGSLLVWFGVGAAAGVGVSGGVALTGRHVATAGAEASVTSRVSPAEPAVTVRKGSHAPANVPAASSSEHASGVAVEANGPPKPSAPPAVREPSNADTAAAAPAVSAAASAADEPGRAASTLIEEAALLQRAERALTGHEPHAALAALDEHERRFPAGVLREERQAARVLTLCELGRTAEARALARAFVAKSSGSVLVPRLEHSCAAPF
jgi:hypothetical protein